MTDLNDDIIVARTSADQRLARIIRPTIAALGFDLVRVRMIGGGGDDAPILQIMAERPDGTMEIDDCAALSSAVSAVLDVEDPIEDEYALEVSSPGMDRPLTRARDFSSYAGWRAKVELGAGLDGRRRFKGRLDGVDDGVIILTLDDTGETRLPLNDVIDAKLVLTDELIAESLRRRRVPDASQADETEYETAAPEDDESGDDTHAGSPRQEDFRP